MVNRMTKKNKEHASKRVNQLVQSWPRGSVFVAAGLRKQGFNSNLLNWYKSSQWLDSVGRGAYKLYGDKVDWYGGLYALQQQLGLTIHVGGKTALFLKGYAHFLTEEPAQIFLFGKRAERLPAWFKQYPWNVNLEYQATDFLSGVGSDSLSRYEHREFFVLASAPERAAFEMLFQVPRRQTFSEALLIMENLTTLRPQLVLKLLQHCHSVQVNRLFMYMAEKHEHPWVEELNLSNVKLGKGKRVIVKGGVLDRKYQITVPREVA